MANNIVVVLLLISLIVTVVLGAYTLTKCDNRKCVPFIALLAAAFMYTLGYLLQTIAGSVERASVVFPVTFIGATYIAPAYCYFVADYCEIRIRKRIGALLIGVPFVYIILAWTTDSHRLILASYEYMTHTPVWHLAVVPGPLYYILHIQAIVCAIAMFVIIIPRLSAASSKHYVNLMLLLAGVVFFIAMDVLFLLKITPLGINLVHSSSTVIVLLFYYNIIRYDLIDIMPIASEMALSSVRDAFILVDQNNKFLRANDAACRLFPPLREMEKGGLISQIEEWPTELTHSDGRETVAFRMGEDNYYTASVNIINCRKSKTLGCIIIIQDITESVRFTKKLEEIAYTDSLTGIYNRRHFINQVAAQIERTRRINGEAYIVLFDVDHFKKVNDTYGHAVGDEVLKMVVDRINTAIRPYDLFGRYGGEEFILSVPDINEYDIRCYMDRLRLAICDTPIPVGGVQLTVTASFGASRLLPEDGIAAAIKVADEALYMAKRDGRNKAIMLSPNAIPEPG